MKKVIIRKKNQMDATGMSIGRLASKIVTLLRGKNKAGFLPHIDNGDAVSIINCSLVKFTGLKLVQKDFFRHSMHPGGLKIVSMKKIFDQDPRKIVERAVYGMLPKNRLRDEYMKRLTLKN